MTKVFQARDERVILVTSRSGFYLAVRVLGRYYRLAVSRSIFGWVYVGRS